jgi:hypothetical protein
MLCTQSWCEKSVVSCCALNSDVKRMLSHVMHSILMRKECYNLAKKMSGFCTSCVVCIAASCCALSPHVEKKCCLLLKRRFSLVHGVIQVYTHPSEVYFWITLSCIILGGREGGTRSVFVGTDFDHRSAVLMFCSCIGLGWFWECNCRAFFVSVPLRSSHFQPDQHSDY